MQDLLDAATREVTAVRLESKRQTAPLERQLKQAEAELGTCHGQIRRLEEQLRGSALALKGNGGADLCAGLLSAPQRTSGGSGGGGLPVDMTYLKNILLKFLECVAAGRLQERDALLPVVGTLVGATPTEFVKLKKLVSTAPSAFPGW